MPRQSSILRKGLALIAIPIFFQLLFSIFLLVRQRNTDEAEHWAIHTKEVIAEAETMFRSVIEADSAIRAFVTTDDAGFEDEAKSAFARIPKQLDGLIYQVRDNPPQVGRMQTLRGEIGVFTEEREALRMIVAGGDRTRALAQLQEVLRIGRVKQIRAKLDEFLAIEETLDKRRVTTLRRLQDQQILVLSIGGVALLGVGLVAALAFSKSIVRRLGTLNENVHRLSVGETLVARVSGHDEISALDASFHQMAADIATAAENEKRYRENIEQRTAELTVINRELNQKSDENEMFVYSVSHDLRSPLVNLQGFGKELGLAMNELKGVFLDGGVPPATRSRAQEILDHGMAEPIHFIQTAVSRLSAIIDALLRLSRAGRVEYQKTFVDVQAVAVRVVDAIQSTISERGARVIIQPGLPKVWADPTAVEQIFANLIGNALNYLDRQRPGFIEVAALPNEETQGTVTFRVKDNGLGIPEAYLSKVFSVFQRVHGNIAPGEGIGLALVRRMVDRHGGRIWLESVDGVGTSFFVSLPTEEPVQPAPIKEDAEATASSLPLA